MNDVVTVAAMALLTYLCRALPLLSMAQPAKLPAWMKRQLEYVPSAVLAAMVAPTVLISDSTLVIRPELLAYGLCLAVAVKTRKLIPPLLLGLVALLVLHLAVSR